MVVQDLVRIVYVRIWQTDFGRKTRQRDVFTVCRVADRCVLFTFSEICVKRFGFAPCIIRYYKRCMDGYYANVDIFIRRVTF